MNDSGRAQGPAAVTITAIIVTAARAGCPLARAALRTGDPAVLASVLRLHPAERCPAMRAAS